MNGPPQVSVILPTRGRSPWLREQLVALATQVQSPPFELVVVANRAGAELDTICDGWDRMTVRVVRADDKEGVCYARNVGIAAALGTKLLFVDDDDVIDQNYVAVMAAALDRHPAVAARIDLQRLNPGWRAEVRDVAQSSERGPEPLLFAYGGTLGARAETVRRIGGFDERLDGIASEDAEWGARLRASGDQFGFVSDAVVHYRLRTGYWALARQGYRYGRGREMTAPRWSGWTWWSRSLLGPLRLVALGPGRGMRRRGVFLLARRLGTLVEHWRR